MLLLCLLLPGEADGAYDLRMMAWMDGTALVVQWAPPQGQAVACVQRRASFAGDAPLGCLIGSGGSVTIRNRDINLQVKNGDTIRLESVNADGAVLAVDSVILGAVRPVAWLPMMGR
jgi:hypothetical protein